MELATRIGLLTGGALVGLYAIEVVLQRQPYQPQDIEAGVGSVVELYSRHQDLPYDPRTPLEVVRELRRRGRASVTTARSPLWVDGEELLPLGGASGAATVLCNETGLHLVYQSDERGFNNPPGLWTRRSIDVALIGDSFVHGLCVSPDSTVAGWMRRAYPATLNLGVTGQGPLRELATIREYLPALRPRVVLWFYYENDFTDLIRERVEPILLRYLASEFSQRLAERQDAIDRAIAREMDSLLAIPRRPVRRVVRSTLRLGALRGRLGLSFRPDPACCDVALFASVLSQARQTVESWGGRMVFVFLPAQMRFGGPRQFVPAALDTRAQVLRIVDSFGIPLVDLEPVFRAQAEPRELWIHGHSHYASDAYRIVAESALATVERLELASAPGHAAASFLGYLGR
jgi:hypothetical protein